MSRSIDSRACVVVNPTALCILCLHANKNKYESVHGFLLGSIDPSSGIVEVTTAVPVAHGSSNGDVTVPLVELALGLCETGATEQVIGWYTAPALLFDTQPGLVASRMASSLAKSSCAIEVLLTLQNTALGAFLTGEDNSTLLTANDKMEVMVVDIAKAGRVTREAIRQGFLIEDFVDHFDHELAANSSWLDFSRIQEFIKNN